MLGYRYTYKMSYTLVAKTKAPETKLKRDMSSSVNYVFFKPDGTIISI